MALIDLEPSAIAEIARARAAATRRDPVPGDRPGNALVPTTLDKVRSVLDDLRHMRRHALQAADEASGTGTDDVANYHLGRASALLDTLDRMEHALR